MKIEIFGSGCMKCRELEKRAKEAAGKAGLNADIEHVYELEKMADAGILSTPALAVDGDVIVGGRVPSVEELVALFSARKR